MGKKPDIKPLLPLAGDFRQSLDHFVVEVQMLRNVIITTIREGHVRHPGTVDLLAERVAALDRAMVVDE